jgi:hypothetical protein
VVQSVIRFSSESWPENTMMFLKHREADMERVTNCLKCRRPGKTGRVEGRQDPGGQANSGKRSEIARNAYSLGGLKPGKEPRRMTLKTEPDRVRSLPGLTWDGFGSDLDHVRAGRTVRANGRSKQSSISKARQDYVGRLQ